MTGQRSDNGRLAPLAAAERVALWGKGRLERPTMPEPIIRLTNEPIDLGLLLAATADAQTGAVAVFLGVTRQVTGTRRTERLEYEAYCEMAVKKLHELWHQAKQRWDLLGGAVVHRLGEVPAGQVSVAIVVATAHREAAFQAARWLIDQIKHVVPIWKKEVWANGASRWVHPGLADSCGPDEEPAS